MSCAKDFDSIFADSTLRVDYILAGNAQGTTIALQDMQKSAGWWGRRVNIDSAPVRGNAQIAVVDKHDGDTLYCMPFSTLFQEWLTSDEVQSVTRAMEGTMLLPLPREDVYVVITLFDDFAKTAVESRFPYSPSDVNIRMINGEASNRHEYLHYSGDPKNKIDVAILGEGYSLSEMELLKEHGKTAVESILAHEPFKSMSDRFNFVLVETPSTQSGVSVPQNGKWTQSALMSQYNTFYSPRYLTTQATHLIHDALRGIPYEHVIILANDDVYGGGGIFNFYTLTTARNKDFKPVVVHEFGHSFGGLADEYFYENDVLTDIYPVDVEPWEGNITTLVDFDRKWAPMLKGKFNGTNINLSLISNGVGVFEGGGYRTHGIYRPVDRDCRMRFNTAPAFCPVCQEVIANMIEFYTQPQVVKSTK